MHTRRHSLADFVPLALASFVALAAACSGGDGPPSPPASDAGSDGAILQDGAPDTDTDTAPVTYYQDIAPILGAKCVACHVAGGIGPFPLDTATAAQQYAVFAKLATQRGDMPPWPPGPLSPRMLHERKLGEEDLRLIAAWADAGAPLGDPARPAPPRPPEVVDIGSADLSFDIGVDYVPDASLSDDYRCFLIDPGMTENRMITGYRITPGNRRIVHHVITTLFAAGDRAALAALDAESPDRPGWPCVGGPVPTGTGVSADGSLGSWVPGVSSVLLPAGTGTAFRAGDLAVVQVHYNLRGGQDPDRTRVEVKLAPRETHGQLQQLGAIRLLKHNIYLPAHQSQIVQENTLPVSTWTAGGRRFYADGDGYVLAVAGHMHMLGTRFTIERRNSQGVTTLLDIPHWHFHWQGSYQLAEPIAIRADDELTIRCVYDNTAERRAHEGVRSPVTDVRWGEGTEDEMCLGSVVVADRRP